MLDGDIVWSTGRLDDPISDQLSERVRSGARAYGRSGARVVDRGGAGLGAPLPRARAEVRWCRGRVLRRLVRCPEH